MHAPGFDAFTNSVARQLSRCQLLRYFGGGIALTLVGGGEGPSAALSPPCTFNFNGRCGGCGIKCALDKESTSGAC